MSNISLSLWRKERKYIILRLLNTFIRERLIDFKTLNTKEKLLFSLSLETKYIQTKINNNIYLFEVKDEKFLQTIKITNYQWSVINEKKEVQKSSNVIQLIKAIFHNFQMNSQEDHHILNLSIDEYKQSVLQHIICQNNISKNMKYNKNSIYYYDYIAAFLDHPLYPTARAKLGFNQNELLTYTIENQAEFKLQWLAIEKKHIQNQGDLAFFWPNANNLGFNHHLNKTHFLLPFHPKMKQMVIDNLNAENIPFILAQNEYLTVLATLSVRTVIIKDYPQFHIKLPLNIRTLSTKNIRTIKASTINDGHQVQSILKNIIAMDNSFINKVYLTDESTGGSINKNPVLGYILRQYPKEINHKNIIPIAAFCANEDNYLVIENIAKNHFNGNLLEFLQKYIDLSLKVHLKLVLKYGIALEANQQNSMLVIDPKTKELSLLFKDNDSARIDKSKLEQIDNKNIKNLVNQIKDKRIIEANENALIQMFTTIILQLNISCILEALVNKNLIKRQDAYLMLRNLLIFNLNDLENEGINTQFIRTYLLDSDYLDIKYLYTSGTFLPKSATKASDINKFYGKTAPNFLRIENE